MSTTEVEVYSDASWCADNSISGGIILYRNCPVHWWSRRQKSISSSTAQAEIFAAALASRETLFVRDLLEDLGFSVTAPTPLHLDNTAAIDLALDPVAFKKTKHILRHTHELRDLVARRFFQPVFVPSDQQLADILTKGLRTAPHWSFIDHLLHTTASPSVMPAPASVAPNVT